MRYGTLVMCILCLLPACTTSPSEDLPRVMTIGIAAEDLDEEKVIVTIDAKGRLFLRDEELEPELLVDRLNPYAGRSRDKSLPQLPSTVYLVLRCDRSAPWTSVQTALRAASDQVNRMNRVLFAVRSLDPSDPNPGTLACFLPLHGGLGECAAPWLDDETEVYIGAGVTVQAALTAFDRLLCAGRKPQLYGMPAEARGEKSHVWMDGKWMILDEVEAPTAFPERVNSLVGITDTYEVGEMDLLRNYWFESGDKMDFPEDDGPFEDPVFRERIGK